MTLEQKREVIRKACISANPEIVELKFGCRVKLNVRKWPEEIITNETGWRGDETEYRGRSIDFWTNEIFEIIGRPIRLADVVLAAKEKRKQLLSTKFIDMPEEVEDWMELLEAEGVENELEYLWYHWKLHQDDLSLQDEPTINFLYEILK